MSLNKLADIATISKISNLETIPKVNTFFISSKKQKILFDKKPQKRFVSDYVSITPKDIHYYDLKSICVSKEFSEWHKKCLTRLSHNFIQNLAEYNDLIPAKFSQLKGYENIYTNDNFNINKTIYKYIRLDYFLDNIQNNNLVFVSPSTWRDPFERKYWDADFSRINFTRPIVHCMCLTTNQRKNEEAAWNLYTNELKCKLIQIAFNTSALLKEIDQYAKRKKCKIYIKNTTYNLTTKEINNLYKKGQKANFLYFSNFDEYKFIDLMSIKRMSFSFENEVRIFIISDIDSPSKNNDLLEIPISNFSELVRQIRLSPYPAFDNKDPRKKIYGKLQNTEAACLKEHLKQYLKNVDVHQSMLYKEIKQSTKIEPLIF